MTFALVVLDFDGTFTLAEAEGAPFAKAFQAALEARLERPLAEEWQRAEAEVRANPEKYGWVFRDKVVAPGNADPYVRCTTIARMLMDRLGLFSNAEQRDQLLNELYQANYAYSDTVFRPGAAQVLEKLLAGPAPVFVVTNSETKAVSKKIESLLPDALSRLEVRGNAKKAFVEEAEHDDDRFRSLPETQTLRGLERPIYLRRGRYFDVLSDIWGRVGAGPESTLVVGDIYELDLAMPVHLGAHVHLVCSETTGSYEKSFVESHERGAVSSDLDAVPARVGV